MRIVWVVGFVPRTNIPAGRILCYHGTNVLSTTKSNLKTYFLLDLVKRRNADHGSEKYGPLCLQSSLRRQVMWSCCIDCVEGLGTVHTPSITTNSDYHLGIPAPGVTVITRKRPKVHTTPVYQKTLCGRTGSSCSRNWRTTPTMSRSTWS